MPLANPLSPVVPDEIGQLADIAKQVRLIRRQMEIDLAVGAAAA